ncbi:MAG: site-specific DNA-methyltransferase, partial [Candidatus Berkelbacteria bacterium]|nr:site-specific DNA-methyltransferase [Candidatus Berkelbacteria bacterium]
MTEEFYKKIELLLKKDKRFVDQEGDLLKNKIIDKAYKADENLVELLLSDKKIKEKFFSKIRDVWVFNINDFVSYIQDKNFLANSYTKYQNKIGLNIGGKFLKERDEVALVWPFKDCVLEGGMTKEDEKRKEIFFNEILAQDEIDQLFAPKVLTNWKRYSASGVIPAKAGIQLKRDKDGTIRENLIIKGNNLLALHSLKQQFQGKIKLIYIDPPYNPNSVANTFTYNNSFNHSTWLTFMKNRLEVAADLLSENGIICIAIDHNELLYLGLLGDEIFNRENRLGIISVVHNPGGRQDDEFFSTSSEFMLVYAKDINKAKINNFSLSPQKIKEYKFKDEKGLYKITGLQRTGNNSNRSERPNLFYPVFIDPKKFDISLIKKKNYIEVLP